MSSASSSAAAVVSAAVVDRVPAMFPGIARTARDLLVTFSTVPDGMPGCQIGIVRSGDGGRTWGEPRIVVEPADPGEAAITHLAVRRLADGSLLMPFSRVRIRGGYERRSATLHMARSHDDGDSWELGGPLALDFAEPLAYGAVVEPEPGVVLCPVWGRERPDERWRSALIRSEDGGRTWARRPVTIGFDPDARLRGAYADSPANTLDEHGDPRFENTTAPDFRPHSTVDGFNETTVALLGDGTLLAILRQQGAGGDEQLWLYRSISRDGGRSWSTPSRLALAGTSPALHRTRAGGLLLGYRAYAPDGSGIAPGTQIARSDDDGATWRQAHALADPRGYRWTSEYQTGYPDFAELDDGSLVVVFYSFDPALPHRRYVAASVFPSTAF